MSTKDIKEPTHIPNIISLKKVPADNVPIIEEEYRNETDRNETKPILKNNKFKW